MSGPLGDFLRLRRQQASIDRFVTPGPRRTPGLRREEVAVAAAVSVDYYTRLEQGREANPSDAVLTAIAAALNLPPDDLRHAQTLRDGARQRPPSGAVSSPDVVRRMQAVVDAWAPFPAYALSFCSDVIAANPQAFDLFVGLDDADGGRPNTCRYLLTNPLARRRFVDWESVARASVASLREHSTPRADDPRIVELVDELRWSSSDFTQWWDGYAVAPRRSSSKTFRRLDGESFTLDYEVMLVPETGVRMTVYLGEVPDAAEVRRLTERATAAHPMREWAADKTVSPRVEALRDHAVGGLAHVNSTPILDRPIVDEPDLLATPVRRNGVVVPDREHMIVLRIEGLDNRRQADATAQAAEELLSHDLPSDVTAAQGKARRGVE